MVKQISVVDKLLDITSINIPLKNGLSSITVQALIKRVARPMIVHVTDSVDECAEGIVRDSTGGVNGVADFGDDIVSSVFDGVTNLVVSDGI